MTDAATDTGGRKWVVVARWTVGDVECMIVKHEPGDLGWGWWCGYVRVPEGHPWHGRDCEEIDSAPTDGLAFGGLTWSGTMRDRLGPGWWIGWDTAHGTRPWDWPQKRVTAETRRLARRVARDGALDNPKEDR